MERIVAWRWSRIAAAALAAGIVAPPDAVAEGDAVRGLRVFAMCAGCHAVGEGARNSVGPHLNDLFGRPAGTLDGARFSKGMVRLGADGLVWTAETLDHFLADPNSMVTLTRMSFGGLPEPGDRADVIAYLRQFSASPRDIPEAEPTADRRDPDVSEREDGFRVAAAILAIEGDPAYGEYLSGECVTCHQLTGEDRGIPSITGWPAEIFVTVMHAYKDKHRPHPVMQSVASNLADEEIAALAAFFEGAE
ncbi:MAG: c-type cytochrome [Pseudomonadota bacterium]